MKISSLSIKNFRGVADAEFLPESLNIFLGRTGAGKTSILTAIGAALTGDISDSDIRKNEESCSVSLQWEDGSRIERIRKKGESVVKVNGKRTSGKSANKYVETLLGVSSDVYRAVCGIDYFKTLSQRDLTAFFLSILPVSINFDKMCEIINDMPEFDVTSDRREELLTEFPEDTPFGLPEIEAAYKSFFEQRRIASRDCKAALAKVSSPVDDPGVKREDLEEELLQIAKQEADFSNYQKRMEDYRRSVKQHETALAAKKNLIKQAEEFQMVEKPNQEILEIAKADKAKFENAIQKSQNFIATFTSNLDLFKRTLASLDKPVCPISEKLVCTTDKSALRNDLETLVSKNEAGIKEYQDFIAKCQEQIAKRNAIIDKYNADLLLYTKKESLEKQIREFIVPEAMEKPEFSNAGVLAGFDPKMPVEQKEAEAKIYFQKRKDAINKLLREVNLYAEFLKNKKALEELQKRENLLNFAVQSLDVKNGMRTKLLERVMQPFETLCNQKLVSLNRNMRMKFSCSDGIQIHIKTEKSVEFIPLNNCSTGEFVIAAYLIMDVVNKVKQTKYVVIDNLDKLDKNYTEQFLSLLCADADSEYEHIFVGASNHEDTCKVVDGICQEADGIAVKVVNVN